MGLSSWLFPDPAPAWMSSGGFWISIVALGIGLMALPTSFQMLCGRPKISIRFESDERNTMYRLKCFISNEGIKNRFLRGIGVVRSPVEISAVATIMEHGTNRVIVPLMRLQLATDRSHGLHVDLPFTLAPARLNLIGYTEAAGAFIIDQTDSQDHIALERGIYRAKIEVITAYQQSITDNRYIIVGNGKPFWSDSVHA